MTHKFHGTLHTTATQSDPSAGTKIIAAANYGGQVWAVWASNPKGRKFKLRPFHIVHWHGMEREQ